MLYDVYSSSFHEIMNLQRKHRNGIFWLQPNNLINGRYSLLKLDEKSKLITTLKNLNSSKFSLIYYILESKYFF
jgi:hypothetical protein